jgi:hypothetical protein
VPLHAGVTWCIWLRDMCQAPTRTASHQHASAVLERSIRCSWCFVWLQKWFGLCVGCSAQRVPAHENCSAAVGYVVQCASLDCAMSHTSSIISREVGVHNALILQALPFYATVVAAVLVAVCWWVRCMLLAACDDTTLLMRG